MNDRLREAVSALADDESPAGGFKEPLQRLIEEPELRREWSRYHLIREAMRGAPGLPADDALATRISAQLRSEPQRVSREPGRSAGWLRPVGGLALAASVATVAVLGVRAFQDPGVAPAPVVAEIQQPRDALPPAVLASGNRWNVERRSVEERLNGYLVNHSEYAGYGVQGMLPYARIVGYDSAEP